MPKKNPGMTPQQQSQAFRVAVRRMIADGELSVTEADAAFARMMEKVNIPASGTR